MTRANSAPASGTRSLWTRPVHALRPVGGLEQGSALRERQDVVTVAVEDQERCVQLVDAAQGRVGVRDEGPRDERVVQAAEFADAAER
jgi:hypothetical protein